MNNAHILGTERIGKLLVQYSIPAIIGMTITSLYNIIDSIFIGHGVGPMGIAGLAITFPLMNLVVAFCTMVSAGGSTISSIRLGQKDLDGATEVLGNTLMFCLVNMVWVVSHFLQKTSVVRLQRGFWKMKKRIISSILSIGMSPFLMNVTACVIVIIVNNSLQQYGGDMAIGAYGIINRLLVLYVMIVLGLTMGMQPIVGYNFGAQKHDRVKATLRLTIIAGVCITSTGFLICELFPHAISAIFTSDEELIDIASRGVRIAVAIFPLVGAQIVIGNFFQSIGKAKISIFLSLTRQLLYLLPGLLIFPHYFGLDGIWICMPVSDFFAFVTAAVALWIYVKRLPTGITEKAR